MLLGPDPNWMIDLRNDLSGETEALIKEYLEDGDNIAVVTLSSDFKSHLNKVRNKNWELTACIF